MSRRESHRERERNRFVSRVITITVIVSFLTAIILVGYHAINRQKIRENGFKEVPVTNSNEQSFASGPDGFESMGSTDFVKTSIILQKARDQVRKIEEQADAELEAENDRRDLERGLSGGAG